MASVQELGTAVVTAPLNPRAAASRLVPRRRRPRQLGDERDVAFPIGEIRALLARVETLEAEKEARQDVPGRAPYANDLAAGYMMGPAGRGGEWSWATGTSQTTEAERLRMRVETLEERDEWLRRQLDGAIEAADAVALTTGLATARAVASDLRDARAALVGGAKQ